MDIENTNVLKYTFMIVPFKFEGKIDHERVLKSGFLKACDHDKIKYDRLYKHVADSISEQNEDRTIMDYWVDREHNCCELFRHTLSFRVVNDNGEHHRAKGYLKDIFLYCFESGIGFVVLNFVFDEKLPLDTMCEVLNKLKKIKRKSRSLQILCDGEEVDLLSLLDKVPQNLFVKYDLFFQHSSKDYVSATMLSSFTYMKPQNEKTILYKLECLKRSQGDSFGTTEEAEDKYLRPFKNMFWGFSTQGIANINYDDPSVGNLAFLKSFYKNVKREYLLMTLIVLNQELTLLDYCQKFSASADSIPSIEDLNRLYNFKIRGTYTTVSHLEHYRTFYNSYMEELGIAQIFSEVDTKQNAIYLTNKNKLAEKKAASDKNINRFTKILSVVLSIFGITGLVNNVANLLNRDNAVVLSAVVLSVVAVVVLLVMEISHIRDLIFRRSAVKRKRKKSKKN